MFKSKTCFSKTVAVSAKRLLFQQNGSQTYVMFQQNIECFSKKQKAKSKKQKAKSKKQKAKSKKQKAKSKRVFQQYYQFQQTEFQQNFNGFVSWQDLSL
jgi:hypothetical protein